MGVSVREARPADAVDVRDVHIASIEGLAGRTYDDAQVAARAHDRDPAEYPIESQETSFVVADRADPMVGFGWMKPEADEYVESAVDGEITAIYVSPSVARRGLGSRIYRVLEARARRKGVGSLGL